MTKKNILLLLYHITMYTVFAQNVSISINATQNKRLIELYWLIRFKSDIECLKKGIVLVLPLFKPVYSSNKV
jgi:hypothetical protein